MLLNSHTFFRLWSELVLQIEHSGICFFLLFILIVSSEPSLLYLPYSSSQVFVVHFKMLSVHTLIS